MGWETYELNQVKENRRVRNWEARRSLRLSRCIVKLLAITDSSGVIATGVVLGRQNTSSVQPPPNMAAANFLVITNGEGCALNGTAVAAVFIDQ